jgi:PAS domain S-box-containing protein
MVWVLLSASLLRNEQDQPQNIIAQVQDISDRYRAE